MKIRLVKKASRIFREQPERAKKCHMRICMKGWRASLRKMTVAERYAVGIAMTQAVFRIATVLCRPIPKHGDRCTSQLAIISEEGPELVLDPRGNVRGMDGRLYDINMNPVAE